MLLMLSYFSQCQMRHPCFQRISVNVLFSDCYLFTSGQGAVGYLFLSRHHISLDRKLWLNSFCLHMKWGLSLMASKEFPSLQFYWQSFHQPMVGFLKHFPIMPHISIIIVVKFKPKTHGQNTNTLTTWLCIHILFCFAAISIIIAILIAESMNIFFH